MTTLTRLAPGSTPRPPAGSSAGEGVPDSWHPRSDDDLIAYTLTVLWALATGRPPRIDVPPAQLPERELIDFWSDPVFDEPSRR